MQIHKTNPFLTSKVRTEKERPTDQYLSKQQAKSVNTKHNAATLIQNKCIKQLDLLTTKEFIPLLGVKHLPTELESMIIYDYLPPDKLDMIASTSKALKKTVYSSKNTRVYVLELSECTSIEDVQNRLSKIKLVKF